MKTYKSRISLVLAAILIVATLLLVWGLALKGQPSSIGKMALNIAIVVLYLFFVIGAFWIRYTIDEGEKVLIVSGFFGLFRSHIDITTIKRISKSRNLLSSPAASFRRICIEYGNDEVLISPRNQAEFLENLCQINPNIELKV